MKRLALPLMMLLASTTAVAQQAPPPTEPAPAKATDADGDSPALIEAYDKGFAALLAGRHVEAAAALERVASQSTNTDRRAAARELARLARLLQTSGTPPPAGRTAQLIVAQENDGRAEFIVTSTLAGFYSSFVLLDVAGVDDFRTGTLLVTAVTGAAFAGSLLGTRNRNITGGMAMSYSGGLVIGLANGLLLAPALGISVDAVDGDGDGEVNQNYLLFGLGTMAVGGGLGGYFGHKLNPTRAQAGVINLAGMAGLSSTGLMLIAVDADIDIEPALAVMALGLDAGVAAGILVSPKIDWSVSRYRLVALSQFLGMLGGVAVAAIAVGEPDTTGDGQMFAVSTLVGMWTGIGLGTYFTRNMLPDARFVTDDKKVSWQLTPLVLPNNGRGLGVAGTF